MSTTVDSAMLGYGESRMGALNNAARRVSGKKTEDEKLREACLDFEAIFIKQMLDAMRKTVNKSGLMDGGMAEDIFEDMLYDERSKLMARNSSLGLAAILYDQLKSEAGDAPAAGMTGRMPQANGAARVYR
ncbi:MAG: rod-binding protein [Spirochaetales bacterium]|jgi:flagellar protein FlgJ|nr:rod-binding protein [Spirochaetales bacterium]